MRTRRIFAACLCTVLLLALSPAWAQGPAAPASTPTLWNFLGIPQACQKIKGAIVNHHGNFPGLEAKPPLKAIADPANLKSPFPAIKAAAEVKQEEDLAPQKIKGIKYLASIGCGCHNVDGKITNAMIAGLSDPTESVRLATAEAIADVAADEPCQKCGRRSCCNKDILSKLAEMAYVRDDFGCYLEPSADVREAAINALQQCCRSQIPVKVLDENVPDVGPEGGGREGSGQPKGSGGRENSASVELDQNGSSLVAQVFASSSNRATTSEPWIQQNLSDIADPEHHGVSPIERSTRGSSAVMERRQSTMTVRRSTGDPELSNLIFASLKLSDRNRSSSFDGPSVPHTKPMPGKDVTGSIVKVMALDGVVRIQVAGQARIPTGTKLEVYHRYLTGQHLVGRAEVVHSANGIVTARSLDRTPFRNVARGDLVRVAK